VAPRHQLTQVEVDRLSDEARVDLLEWIWRLQRRGWPTGLRRTGEGPLELCEVRWRHGEAVPDVVTVVDDFGYPWEARGCPLELPESVLLGA